MNNIERLIRRAINDQIEKVIVPNDGQIPTCTQMEEVRGAYRLFLIASGILKNPDINIRFRYFSNREDSECTLFRIMILTEFARIQGIDL